MVVGGPTSTFQPSEPRWSARRRRRARRRTVLEQRAHQPALGRLVEVADHLPASVDLVQHAHRGDPAGEVRRRPPERGVRRRAQVDQQAAAERVADHRVEVRAPVRRDPAEPGEGDVTGQSVGGDRVTRAHQAEHRRGHRQPPRRAAACGRVERGDVESLVEHSAVDLVRPRGPGRVQGRVARHLAGLPDGQPQHPERIRVLRAGAHQRVEHLPAGVREPGERQPVEVEPVAAPRRRLALGGRQQDQHRASLGGV